MDNKQHSAEFLRQRKFYLVAPFLVLPFVIMFFAALGGGHGPDTKEGPTAKGLNTTLPNAHLKDDRGKNKMAYYEQAAADSAKLQERMRNQAYYDQRLGGTDTVPPSPAAGRPPQALQGAKDPNEERVYQKLNLLNAALNKTVAVQDSMPTPVSKLSVGVTSSDIDRLEKMMRSAKGGTDEPDPQMERLDGMLDKLLATQHPMAASDSAKGRPVLRKAEVFPVSKATASPGISRLSAVANDSSVGSGATGRFYTQSTVNTVTVQNVIEATIPETQTLVSGATVKLQLSDDIYINGMQVHKGTYVNGTAALNNERLAINISTIRSGANILPVSLQVYDQDGMAGIYMPGAITRDVAKQSADESINTLGATSLDPSLGAQAAAAGIQLAKSVISKKVKLVRVTVKSGYRVFLKDNNQH